MIFVSYPAGVNKGAQFFVYSSFVSKRITNKSKTYSSQCDKFTRGADRCISKNNFA